MNILQIHNSTGSRLYRILPQAKYLAANGHNVKVRGLKAGQTGGIADSELQWADIVAVEMIYSPEFIQAVKKAGAKMVYELDDLMESVPKKHYAYKDMNPLRTYLTYKCLRMADAITCTVDELKRHYKYMNQNIHVMPNYCDLDFWDRPHLPNTSDKIRLGWVGGNSHKEDLEFIAPVIKRVVKKYPNVKFVCCGFGGAGGPDKWIEYNYGENLFKDLPPEQYEFSLGSPMEVFPSKLASLRLDVAVAPVIENNFAKCKSACKYLEYGLNQIPGVYADFLYGDTVLSGSTGLLAKEDPEEWFKQICFLIDNEELRKKMGKQAREHVIKDHSFEQHGHKWLDLYEKIISE